MSSFNWEVNFVLVQHLQFMHNMGNHPFLSMWEGIEEGEAGGIAKYHNLLFFPTFGLFINTCKHSKALRFEWAA